MTPVPLYKKLILWRQRLCRYTDPVPMPYSFLFWLATALVGLAVLTFSGYFSWLLTTRYDAFVPSAEDFGIMDQALWNTVHGHFLHETICNILYDTNCTTTAGVMRFAIHFEPILVPISTLYLIWDNPKIILILQTLVVASGAFPAFWLARLRLRNELAAVGIAILYLLYPAQQQALIFDFHAVTLTTALLLYLLYFVYMRRTLWICVFALLCMACKEEIPLVVAMIGLWSFIFQGRRTGLVLLGVGFLWFLLATLVIMPLSSPTGHPLLVSHYGGQASLKGLFVNAVRHPKQFLAQYIWEKSHLDYLRFLLSPAFYLPLLAPWALFIAVPSLAVNLLSTNYAMYSGLFHYNAEIVPILIFSTIEALFFVSGLVNFLLRRMFILIGHLLHNMKNVSQKQSGFLLSSFRFVIVMGMIVGALWNAIYTNYYFHGQMPYSFGFNWPSVSERNHLAQKFLDMIPSDASVSTQIKLVPHISHRQYIYLFPFADDEADYILLDRYSDPYPFRSSQDLEEGTNLLYFNEVQKVLMSGQYGVIAAQDGFLLLKRGSPPPTLSPFSPAQPHEGVDPAQILFNLPASYCSDMYVDANEAQNKIQVDFTTSSQENIHLLGFSTNIPSTITPFTNRVQVTTYWKVDAPITTPLRELLLLQNDDDDYFVSTEFPSFTWCPSVAWQPGKVLKIDSIMLSLQRTKVPKGSAHISIALLPLVQSSSTIMDVQARLPLRVVNAPASLHADTDTRALQLQALNFI